MANSVMKQARTKVILDTPWLSAIATLLGISKVFGMKLSRVLSTGSKLVQRRGRSPNLGR